MARRVTGAHVRLGSAGGRGGGSMGTRIDNKPLTFPASDRIVVLCDQIGIIDQLWGPIDREEEVLRFTTFLQTHLTRAEVERISVLGDSTTDYFHKPCWYTHRSRPRVFLYAGADTITAPSAFHASLHHLNKNYLRDSLSGKIDVPVVRVLKPDTLGDFREWKIRTSGVAAVGQVKVPVVV
ncbi:hypothetical protein EDD15DRAFT_2197352 [Pisolithus albus]|nr:hypothetical protein EDD15DRAFT_2197352 [Pisolithus albus]